MSPLDDPEALAGRLRSARAQGLTVVFTNGCFDVLHRGHVEYLTEARALGDLLVVGLNSDDSVRKLKGPGRPLNGLLDRALVLKALRAVDHVVAFAEDTPAALVEKLDPQILVKGGDYRPEEVAGADWVLSRGGQVHIARHVPGFSTSGVLERLGKVGRPPEA